MNNLLDEFIQIAKDKLDEGGVWREDPVDLLTFFKDKDYLNETPFPGKQTELLETVNEIVRFKILGDEDYCSDELQRVTELAVAFGKGCKSGDTTIIDPITGETYTFKELYSCGKKINVLSFNENSKKFVVSKASEVVRVDKGEIWEVITESGRKTKVFPEHKFANGFRGFTKRYREIKWKTLRELKVGDKIGVYTNNSKLSFDRIAEINYMGEDYYYDLTVDEYANYVSDGFLDHNSGKDFLASGILAYMCYVVCCIKDPQEFFGFGQDEPIDLINVAINAYQANNVFFKKFKARLVNCKWFKRVNYNPAEMEGSLYNEFQITKNQIRFYKNITAHSAHSEADSFEGFNPLIVIFDEIGGFEVDKAESAYKTLRSSATSRYNDKVLLIFISFPRSSTDFMIQKLKEAETDPEVYAIVGKSWEVNPKISRESLQKDYDRDPESAKMKYECEPPLYATGLFQFPEKVDEVVAVGKKSQCQNLVITQNVSTRTLYDGQQRHFTGLELFNLNLDPTFTYYIGGDGGVASDSYVICLMHAEPTLVEVIENGESVQRLVNKPVEDLILEWEPSKKDRLPVDLLNVADILEQICKQVHVKKALFDKFNSADVVQRLMTFGVEAEDKNFSNPFQVQIYQNLKGLIYTGNISLLDHTVESYVDENKQNANEELKAIQFINGNKVDHLKGKNKDYSDARAAASWICSTDDPQTQTHFAMPAILGTRR